MNLSKTTANFALKRNLEVTEEMGYIEDTGTETTEVWVWEKDNDMEPLIIFNVYPNGGMSFKSNIYLPQEIKEELPAFMKDEKHFRKVLNFIASELYKGK